MRKTTLTAVVLASLVAPSLTSSSAFADDEEGDEGYTYEKVVFGQRRLVMAPNLIRPDISFFVSGFPGVDDDGSETTDIAVGFGVIVDWTPIDKLQVGAIASPRLAPDADVGDPALYVRYLLLDMKGFELGVEGQYTFSDPGAITLGIPLRYHLNKASHLDFTPQLDINLPPSGGDVVLDLNLLLGVGVSLTRAFYIDLNTGFIMPDFDSELAAIPLGLELGYSLEGGDDKAFLDIFLRARFDAFLRPSAPEGVDAVNLDIWTIALGVRGHFALD